MAQITSDGYSLTRVNVNAVNDGDNTVIAAPGAGRAILVIAGLLRAVAAGNVIVRSGAAGTVHDSFAGTAAPGTRVQYDSDPDIGEFVCDTNTALVINNAAGVDTFGQLIYRVINA